MLAVSMQQQGQDSVGRTYDEECLGLGSWDVDDAKLTGGTKESAWRHERGQLEHTATSEWCRDKGHHHHFTMLYKGTSPGS